MLHSAAARVGLIDRRAQSRARCFGVSDRRALLQRNAGWCARNKASSALRRPQRVTPPFFHAWRLSRQVERHAMREPCLQLRRGLRTGAARVGSARAVKKQTGNDREVCLLHDNQMDSLANTLDKICCSSSLRCRNRPPHSGKARIEISFVCNLVPPLNKQLKL